jgi:hypothetical protein
MGVTLHKLVSAAVAAEWVHASLRMWLVVGLVGVPEKGDKKNGR